MNWFRQLLSERLTLSDRPATSSPIGDESEWQRIAELKIEGLAGKSRLPISPESSFRLIKLRSRQGDVEVYRWTLLFDDGTLQELSINCLFEGSESRPILIAGRRLNGMVVEYDAPRTKARGILEILGQPNVTQ